MKLIQRLLLCLLVGFATAAHAQLPEQECNGAIPVCQPTYTQANSYSGFGLTQELNFNNRGCLQSGERNSVWYTINVSSSGILVFSITPPSISDYDFALWDITGGGCQALYNGLQPVRCNFNGVGPGGNGATGISNTITGPSWGPALNVNAGETYLLNVSNFSSNQNGYSLSFIGSTASVFDTVAPRLSAASTICGLNSDTVRILMSEPVLCSSIAPNGSDFTITPSVGGVSIVSATSTNCANNGLSTLGINLTFSTALPSGTYTISSVVGTDGNSLLDNCTNSLATGGTASFTVGTPPPPIYKLLRAAPCGQKALFSITPPVSGIYSLAIKQGTTTIHSFSNVSGSQVDSLGAGSYTATLTNSGCSSTVAFTIIPIPPTVSFSITPACVNSSNGAITPTITGASGPWTYAWSTTPVQTTATATGLPVGTYTLSADNGAGCSFTRTATVTSVPGFPMSTTQTDATCNGTATGTATAVPSGGTAPYTYSWNTTPVQTTATATGLSVGSYTVTAIDATGCTVTASATITQPTVLTAATTTTAASCAVTPTGTATVTAAGGTAPYTYSWNTTPAQTTQTATALTQGTYTVTVTDAKGCTKTVNAIVPQSPAVTATATATAASCAAAANGTATVTAAAGTPPYTYSWNTTPVKTTATATGLQTGAYTATVTDAASCTTTVTINVPAGPGISGSFTNKTQPLCFGQSNGAATFTPTGGATPYTYAWSNGQSTATATGLSAGFYSVITTDANGCSRTDTFTLNQPSVLSTTVQADSVSCFGGANGKATATPTGGTAPYTYNWNTSPAQTTAIATNLTIGNYSVIVTDAKGCTVTGATTVDQPTAPLSIITGVQKASCPGLINGKAYAVPSGGTPPYTYVWTTSPSQTTDTAFNLLPLTYNVIVRDQKACSLTQSVVVPGFVLATSQTAANCNNSSDGTATVTPAGGIAPYTYAWNTTPVQTDSIATGLLAGTYTASVTDASGCTITKNATVTSPAAIVITPTITAATCAVASNGKASVSVAGGRSPYTYLWSNGQTTSTATGLSVASYSVTVTDANGCTETLSVSIPMGTGIGGSFTRSTQPSCFGQANGSVTFTPTGGNTPYTYLWDNGQTSATATGLIVGTYSVLTTDANGCTRSDTFTLTQPAALQATVQTSPVSCFGGANGTATATATGGTAPYSYSWNTTPAKTTATATGLSAGARRVTVTDANGCIAAATDTVRQPTALVVVTGVQKAGCPGQVNGKAFATPSGGTAPYTYSWNTTPTQTTDTANSLLPGSYSVTVTDAKGCTATQTVTVTGFTVALTQTNVACNGGATGSATVVPTGGIAPYTYSWNTTPVQTTATATNLGAGNYTASVTDAGGCTLNTFVDITEPLPITATHVVTAATCTGAINGTAAVTVSGGTAPYTYSWNTTPVKTTAAVNGLAAGAYAVTVKDAKNCTATFPITVPVGAGVSGSFTSAVSPTCFGSANGSASFVPTGGNTPYTYLWSNGQTSSSATSLAAGSWSVRVTDASGCIYRDTVTLTQPTALQATVQTTPVACFGGASGTAAVTVSGGTSPYSYSWNTTPSRTTSTITGMASGSYAVSITDAKGCPLVRTATITQPAALSAATGTQATLCPGGASGKAWVTVAGGNPPYTYSWNSTPVQTTDTARNLLAGPYTVIINDSKNCGITRAVNVSNATFTLSLTQTNALCFGAANGSATVTVTGGRAPYTYLWSNGQNTAFATMLSAGSHTVTVTDANGCVQTATAIITQPAAPLTATTTPTNPSCFGNTNGTVALVASGGTAPYTYSWSNGQTSANANGLAAGNWSVQVTDAKGCIYNTSGTLTQPAALQGLPQTTNVSCNGGNDGTATVAVSGGITPYTYNWNTVPVQTTPVITGLTAGTYRVTITDAQNCVSTYTATVTQPTAISIAVSSQQSSCASAANGKAYATPTGGTPPYTYSWSSGQTTDSATGLLTGTYTVTVTDSKGCVATQNVTVGAAPGVQASVAISKIPCVGAADGSLNGIAANGVAPYTYSWNTTPIQTTQTANNLISGAYLLTVTDASGCVDTETAVLPNLPLPIVFAGGNKNVCAGDSIRLAGSGTAASYLWTPATALSCTTCVAPVCKPTVDRRYTLTGTGANGCVNTDTAWIRVIRRVPVSVGPTQRICQGNPATLTAKGGDTYSWAPVATVNNATDSSTFARPDTTTNYRVIIGQNNCFWDTLYQKVEVYTTPVITMPKEIPALYNTKVRLSAVVENGPFLQWAPADNLDCDACTAPIALVTGSLTYVLTASNAGGCEATGYLDIITNCDPKNYFIPTAFTPDGDGENRWFFPKSKDPGIMRSMKIFDRWGKLVYNASGIPFNSAQVGWDGTYQGQAAPQGVYVYIIEAECVGNQTVKLQGDVTLLR